MSRPNNFRFAKLEWASSVLLNGINESYSLDHFYEMVGRTICKQIVLASAV